MSRIKHNWTLEELQNMYDQPLLELVSEAHAIHHQFHDHQIIQVCSLISIKTGGCPEDCRYCAQSSHYQTSVAAQPLMDIEVALKMAKQAIERGATRICLGAAWREVRDGRQFDQVLKIVQSIAEMGVEVCCTLGMLKEHQAQRLKEAGLYAYNHNLDTSEQYYPTIISTRSYQDRLNTLDVIEKSDLSVCCGGILGMGESIQDRLMLLQVLSRRQPHPESLPINMLGPVPGTPLENEKPISFWEMLRMVAVTRCIMPKTMVRLSADRLRLSNEQQALCFLAGANSIFAGERLLTIANRSIDQDEEMFQLLGLKKRPAFLKENP